MIGPKPVVVLGPVAKQAFDAILPSERRPGELHALPYPPPALTAPAVLLLAPDDLLGAHRQPLLELARAGRTVLLGGTRHREVLLDAINVWRVFRVLPESPPREVLLEALAKAHEAATLELGLEQTARELRAETTSLEEAVVQLEAAQQQLRHAERLSTLGRITSSIIPIMAGHLESLQEFNTLLGRSGSHDPRVQELLGYAFTGIRSLHTMLDEVRAYAASRPESYRLELEDADEVVRFATSFLRFDPLLGKRRLEVTLAARARIHADCFRLYQTLITLLRRAFLASPADSTVTVSTTTTGDTVVMDLDNTGAALSAEACARMFEPFSNPELGMGLALCRTTVERHGGTISCDSQPGRTRVTIRLPRATGTHRI